MFKKTERAVQRVCTAAKSMLQRHHGALFMAALLVLGLVCRWLFFDYVSTDMALHLRPWLADFQRLGGLRLLGNLPGNYTPPYMLLLALVSYVPAALLDAVYAVKLVSVVGDVLLAFAAWALARQLMGNRDKARIAFAAVWMLPTGILNSAVWGQCDAWYTAFLLLMLVQLLRGRDVPAMVFFGVALAFKQQAVFLAPLVVVLVVAGRVRLRAAFAAVGAYAALFLPGIVMGAPVSSLWDVYRGQAGLDRGVLVKSAPNLYNWLSFDEMWNEHFTRGYLVFGLCCVGIFCYWLWRRANALRGSALVCAALFLGLLVPYVMPRMHERYFFLAGALAVLFAVWQPRRWYVAVACELMSLACYLPFLFEKQPPVPMELLALVPPALLAAVGFTLWRDTRVDAKPTE